MSDGPLRRLGLVLSSVLLCILAVHPFDLWPAALLSWAPLILAVDKTRAHTAFGLGLAHGIILNALGFYWIVPALRDVAARSFSGALVIFLALVVAQGARTALVALLLVLGRRRGWPRPIAFPIALVTAELVYPLVFPWYSALFAAHVTAWRQLAELGGPLLISFWLAMVNAAVSEIWLWQRYSARRALAWAGVALASVGLATVVGQLRLVATERRIEQAPKVRIGVVQGGTSPAKARGDSVAVYKHLTHEILRSPTPIDLVVWPESVVSYPVASTGLSNFLHYLPVPERSGTGSPSPPLLLGMVLAEGDAFSRLTKEPVLKNAAVLAFAGGRVAGRYDKRRLVLVGERAPWDGLPLLGDAVSAVNRFDVGDAHPVIEIRGRRLGVSICFEAILHREFLDGVRAARPHLLVNLTSDSWFVGSPGPHFHLALASLRAVEHRRFLLRATTTGITALIDPAGRVVWSLPEGKAASGVATARWLEEATIYSMIGEWPWVVVAGAAVLSLLVGAERARRWIEWPRRRRG